MRNIQYGIDSDGFVISRVGSEIAIMILDYEHMSPENKFEKKFNLEKSSILEHSGTSWLKSVRWTRKIPVEIKNLHRAFWGMKAFNK